MINDTFQKYSPWFKILKKEDTTAIFLPLIEMYKSMGASQLTIQKAIKVIKTAVSLVHFVEICIQILFIHPSSVRMILQRGAERLVSITGDSQHKAIDTINWMLTHHTSQSYTHSHTHLFMDELRCKENADNLSPSATPSTDCNISLNYYDIYCFFTDTYQLYFTFSIER